ncbi:hypothetical protein [Robbsia sp. KACC 23696]|uniref:hypothetical protein n=1 Tax=Robbsia sp. KACC 23696 TaxID=3149231 RepID=UPI00325BE4DC
MTWKVALIAALAVAGTDGVVPTAALPDGVEQGKTRFTILDSTGAVVQTQDVDGLEAEFTGVADGTFDATAQFLDSTGALLGDAVKTSFVDGQPVTPPAAATYTPLASLTATVTAE